MLEMGSRKVQTQVKHLILDDYMTVWRSIIISGLSGIAAKTMNAGRPFHSRLLYVDGFSYKGRYSNDEGTSTSRAAMNSDIWGSPIIGVQAMDRAIEHAANKYRFPIESASILFEWEHDNFVSLLQNLENAGIDPKRIVVNPKTINPKASEIVVVHDDFTTRYPEVLDCLEQQYTKGFVLLDPYGMKGLPYEMVRRFVALPNSDVMINWPYLDIQRKQGRLKRSSQRVVSSDEAILANIDEMYGTSNWKRFCGGDMIDDLPETISGELESELSNLYREQLQSADTSVTVKSVPIMFGDAERTIYYLYLTTHDPCGALELNEILDNAKFWELGVKWNLSQDRYVQRLEARGQQSLFDLEVFRQPIPAPPERIVEIQKLGMGIHREWIGQCPTRKEVLRSQVNTSTYQSEIHRALNWLKKVKLAEFSGTKVGDRVQFIEQEIFQ